MTSAAVASAPHDTTLLPVPTAAEVVLLQAVQDYPAVSVLCTAQAAPRMPRAAAGRLSRLVTEAGQRLRSEFGSKARDLERQLEALSQDAMSRPTRGAVALYVGSAHRSAWGLPVSVVDRTVIDPTFATRGLVRSLHRTPRHVVLVLTEREARLFDAVAETLLPPPAGPFPITATRTRPDRPGRASGPRRATAVEADEDAFLRTVDRALGTYLTWHPAPLVLVGAHRTLTRFTHLSRNLGRLAGTVSGSHLQTPLPVLAALIRPVLESYLRSRQSEALALLETREGAGRVVTGMRAVWLASRIDRPEMLAVEQGLFYPARLSSDGDFLEPATDVEHPEVIDDAVDEVIEVVLRRGGWIALVEDGALAPQDRIALSLLRR